MMTTTTKKKKKQKKKMVIQSYQLLKSLSLKLLQYHYYLVEAQHYQALAAMLLPLAVEATASAMAWASQ